MAHTPGPWFTGAGNFGVIRTAGSQPLIVATVREETLARPYRPGEMLANARLIAAAPDLLAACQQGEAELLIAVRLIEQPATDPIAWVNGVRDRLRAAIAKAEEK